MGINKVHYHLRKVVNIYKKKVFLSIYTIIQNLSTLNFVWKFSPSLSRLLVTKRKRKGVRG